MHHNKNKSRRSLNRNSSKRQKHPLHYTAERENELWKGKGGRASKKRGFVQGSMHRDQGNKEGVEWVLEDTWFQRRDESE